MKPTIFVTVAVAIAVLAGFWFKPGKPRGAQVPVQIIPEFATAPERSHGTGLETGPQQPIPRALYLRGKMMQSPRETAQMFALFSDENLIESARTEWVAGQAVTRDTGFLRRALEWKDNPKRVAVIAAIQQILTLPSVSTVEQQARQTELLVLLIQNAPGDFKRIKPRIAKDLIFEANQYFHRYTRI